MCTFIHFPIIQDIRGNLTFLQHPDQLPFAAKRIFWSYDIPGGEVAGGHAFRSQEEVIIALSGSFDVVVTNSDGSIEKFSMKRSTYGLYVPAKTWRHLENFSTNALALHVASHKFYKDDYIKDFKSFCNEKKG